VIYALFRPVALALLKAPTGPPEPPAGAHATVEVFRASPRFLYYRLLGLAIGAALFGLLGLGLLVGGLAAREEGPLAGAAVVLALALVILLPSYLGIRVDYDLRYYVLTDRSLRVREGAWILNEQTLTHANVQNLEVKQGPLQRLFGITDLVVHTAGGGGRSGPGEHDQAQGHTVTIAGVEDARLVREKVLGYLRAHRAGSGLGDLDDETDGSPGSGLAPGAELEAALAALRDSAAALHRAARAARA
jgi:membrane protein YdbS with pleckstrin-like domain